MYDGLNGDTPIVTQALDDLPVRSHAAQLEVRSEDHPDGSFSMTLSYGTKVFGTITVPPEDVEKIKNGEQP